MKQVATIKLSPTPEEADVPVRFVGRKYTSKRCPACRTIDDKNRPDQAIFSCISCRHAGHADVIAARNISCRAAAEPGLEFCAPSEGDGKAACSSGSVRLHGLDVGLDRAGGLDRLEDGNQVARPDPERV